MPPKTKKVMTKAKAEAANQIKIGKNGFIAANTLFKLIMCNSVETKKYARSLMLEYIKIHKLNIIECVELKSILSLCFVDKTTRISVNGTPEYIRSLHINLKLLSFLCQFDFPFDIPFNKITTIMDSLFEAMYHVKSYDVGDTHNIVPAIKMLLYFDIHTFYPVLQNMTLTRVGDINLCELRIIKQCNYKKIKLILISFREGLTAFGLLPTDMMISILLYLNFDIKYAKSLVDIIIEQRKNQISSQDKKRKKI